ncbi:MAG TPA: hypothetical protein VGN31_13575 [Paraburkholderia sp.]
MTLSPLMHTREKSLRQTELQPHARRPSELPAGEHSRKTASDTQLPARGQDSPTLRSGAVVVHDRTGRSGE